MVSQGSANAIAPALTFFVAEPTLYPSINRSEEGQKMTVVRHAALRGAAR